MKNTVNRERAAWDWFQAFQEHGRNRAAADALVTECQTWAANNPDMSWQDVFDAVLLADETKGAS